MDKALLIQLGGSITAVALLVAFAAWLGVARATPPLDTKSAKALLDLEFPDHKPDAVWIAADGAALIAREGALAFLTDISKEDGLNVDRAVRLENPSGKEISFVQTLVWVFHLRSSDDPRKFVGAARVVSSVVKKSI